MELSAETCWGLGEKAREAGKPREALQPYRRTLALMPSFMPALANLSLVLSMESAGTEALKTVRRAVSIAPEIALLHLNLGNAFFAFSVAAPAARSFRCALTIDPAYAEAWLNLGVAVHGEGRLSAACGAARRALSVRPAYAEAWNNLANARRDQGFIEGALIAYDRAVGLRPDYADAARNRLAARLYLDDDDERAGEEAADFFRRYGSSRPQCTATTDPDPERRIRVGLLSADLRDHPVGRNLASFFRHRDPASIDLVCYDVGTGDKTSAWFRARSDLWRSVGALSDAAIAEVIHADRVDVLIVLAGRFDRNHPLVASYRAAPVQAAMHDGGPSGLGGGDDPAIDAWITDAVLHPAGTHAGGDRLLRLPVFYSFPSPDLPPVPRRAEPDKGMVLGSFSNPAKLSHPLLKAWGQVLTRLPAAQLRLKYRTWYADPEVQARVAAGIAAGGGDPGRIDFRAGADDASTHLQGYGGIDLVLDPFPFSGATASFEALAMGVPVLTLAGRAAIGRTTASILMPLGLEELVVASVDDYVVRAVALAGNPSRLRQLRGEIASRLATSPLVDGESYTAALTRALRGLWRDWCARSVVG